MEDLASAHNLKACFFLRIFAEQPWTQYKFCNSIEAS